MLNLIEKYIMNSFSCKLSCLVIVVVLKLCETVELTFELPDNAKECFYQDIEKNQTATLEFQVIIIQLVLQFWKQQNCQRLEDNSRGVSFDCLAIRLAPKNLAAAKKNWCDLLGWLRGEQLLVLRHLYGLLIWYFLYIFRLWLEASTMLMLH